MLGGNPEPPQRLQQESRDRVVRVSQAAAPAWIAQTRGERVGPLLGVKDRAPAGGTKRPRHPITLASGEVQLALRALRMAERDAKRLEAEQAQHRLELGVRLGALQQDTVA